MECRLTNGSNYITNIIQMKQSYWKGKEEKKRCWFKLLWKWIKYVRRKARESILYYKNCTVVGKVVSSPTPQCGSASPNQLKTWMEQKGWVRGNSSYLSAKLGHLSCLVTDFHRTIQLTLFFGSSKEICKKWLNR